jgi:hypothetical protein
VIADLEVMGTPAYFPVHAVKLIKSSRDAAAEERFLATAKHELEASWAPVIERRRTAAK